MSMLSCILLSARLRFLKLSALCSGLLQTRLRLSTGLILLSMADLFEHDYSVIQLIPSLEKYPSLVQFSKTSLGKLLIATLFAPPLYFMGHQIWIIAPVLIFIFSIFQPQGLSFFFFVSGVFIFLFWKSSRRGATGAGQGSAYSFLFSVWGGLTGGSLK